MPHPPGPPGARPARNRLALGLIAGLVGLSAFAADLPAQEPGRRPPALALPVPGGGHPIRSGDPAAPSAGGSAGWWYGPAGIVLALAAFGGVGVLLRRPAPGPSGALSVVGRLAIAPRQSVVMLRAGDRVLLLGVGGQGPPTLLGELEEAEAVAPASPLPRASASPTPTLPPARGLAPAASVRLGGEAGR